MERVLSIGIGEFGPAKLLNDDGDTADTCSAVLADYFSFDTALCAPARLRDRMLREGKRPHEAAHHGQSDRSQCLLDEPPRRLCARTIH